MSSLPGLKREELRNVRLLAGGVNLIPIPQDIISSYQQGDRLVILPDGEVLHIPTSETRKASEAVEAAHNAFVALSQVDPEHITQFYHYFASALSDDAIWEKVVLANQSDVATARQRGRSTTRLVVSEAMRKAMIEGLHEWEQLPSTLGHVIDSTQHEGWQVDQVISPLGIVAFVFEGRPNVFADATGVLRSGNTAVMRIGGDALGTATAIVEYALNPALFKAHLPEGSVSLVNSRSHASGWALFSDPRIALAVARGSGRSVRQLGSVARQAGIPASLHGTGGAWIVADETADLDRFRLAVIHSLDRKVCNTLNTVCLTKASVSALLPELLSALEHSGSIGNRGYRIHACPSARPILPSELFNATVSVHRPTGICAETIATPISEEELSQEWEWEGTPEISFVVAEDLKNAARLYNQYSPQFVTSIISGSEQAEEFFFRSANAPFFGNGFTRWVDGQFALKRPELGLSNWQNGRLLGRGGILSGDGIYTIRLRVRQHDPDIHR